MAKLQWVQTNGGTQTGQAGNPPSNCDICNSELVMICYDALTTFGRWGWLCPSCFVDYGIGLGLGKGQKYERKAS